MYTCAVNSYSSKLLFDLTVCLFLGQGPSDTARYHRLRRICMKKKNGKCAVPPEIHQQWVSGGEGRAALEAEFERCGFDKASREWAL